MTGHTAYVFDLDGVVRDFAPGDPSAAIEAALSLPSGHVAATAFHADLLLPTVTGRQTYDDWYAAICAALEDATADPGQVRHHMERWRSNRGTAIDETVERLEALRSAGHRTYVFTNGTDQVPAELELLGLRRLFDGILNTSDFGVAKPDPLAYAAAHRAIERDLGRELPHDEVWFTDDLAVNVEAAREFGWDAEVFSRA